VLLLRVTNSFSAGTGLVVPDGAGVARHAVVAVALGRAAQNFADARVRGGELLVCVRNSWGPGWGHQGHALVTETALSLCLERIVIVESITASERSSLPASSV